MAELEKEVIDYKLKLNAICAAKNAFTLGCFTVLAIVFNKWWIVLLSGLFLNSVGNDEKKE